MEKVNILIADDDLEILELMSTYLSAEGYIVSCVGSGDDYVTKPFSPKEFTAKDNVQADQSERDRYLQIINIRRKF